MPAFAGAIFDVDGVLVDSPQEQAWQEAAGADGGRVGRRRRRAEVGAEAFTPLVFRAQMSGTPRLSGACSALEFFEVPDDGALAKGDSPLGAPLRPTGRVT